MDFNKFHEILKGFLEFGVIVIKLRDDLRHSDASLNQLDLVISCIKVIKVRLDLLIDELYKRKEILRNEKTEVRKISE